jgi:hypothetical protein
MFRIFNSRSYFNEKLLMVSIIGCGSLGGYSGMLDQAIPWGLEHPVVWVLMEIAINNQQVNMVNV